MSGSSDDFARHGSLDGGAPPIVAIPAGQGPSPRDALRAMAGVQDEPVPLTVPSMWDGKILVRRGRFLWHATFSYGLIEVYSGNTPKHWYGLTERQAVNRVRRYVQKHAIETVARSYGVK